MTMKEIVGKIECSRCGRHLALGSLKYLVTISVTADFDGVIPDEAAEEDIRQVLKDAAAKDQEELERDVHQHMAYVLCKPCRDLFIQGPIGPAPAGTASTRGTIH